jgi:hypothetical protein
LVYILQSLPLHIILPERKIIPREVYIEQCKIAVETSEYVMRHWPPGILAGRTLFLTITPLIPILHDARTHDLVIRGCQMIYFCSKSYPVFRLLLKSIQSIANGMNLRIPAAAIPLFTNLIEPSELHDLPLSFTVPRHKEIMDLVTNHQDQSPVGAELSSIISKWFAISVN